MRPLPDRAGLYHRRVMSARRFPRRAGAIFSLARLSERRTPLLAIGLVGLSVLAACTEVDLVEEAPYVVVDSSPPTTLLNVGFLEVAGYSFCSVVEEVAPEIRVYADPASNFGSASDVRDAYVGAFRAFDAIDQVAPDEISDEAELLRTTLDDAVDAALAADWDVTAIERAAAGGVDAQRVADALAAVRTYARDRCAIDIVEADTPPTGSPNETTEQRIRRILEYVFPDLDEAKIACLEPRLPADFDPQSDRFDPTSLEQAFAGCRVDINDPGAPTSVPPAPFTGPRPTTPSVTTAPSDTRPEFDGA